MKLLAGTNNPGKQEEIRSLLKDLSIELVFPAELPETKNLDPKESGETIEANALLKARAFAQASQIRSFSDDTGLEITALNGEPGVKSKRFFPGSDHDRNVRILELLKNSPDRTAQFKTVICLFDPQTEKSQFVEGILRGTIATAIDLKSTFGFGYDAIFIPEGYNQPLSALGEKIKNSVSHRAKALQALKDILGV